MLFLVFLSINLLSFFVNGDSFCSSLKSVKDLDLNQLTGQWWEYQSKKLIGEHDCLTINFYNPEKNKLTMIWDYVLREPDRMNDDHITREWFLTKSSDASNADTFYSKATQGGNPLYQVRVIDINPGSWVVMYVCSKYYSLSEALILTKKQTPEKAETFRLEEKLRTIFGQYSTSGPKTRLRGPEYPWYQIKDNTKCKPVDFPEKWYELSEE